MNRVTRLFSGVRKPAKAFIALLTFVLMTVSFANQAQTPIVTTVGNVSGCPEQQILVPVSVDNFTGVAAGNLRFTYDTSVMKPVLCGSTICVVEKNNIFLVPPPGSDYYPSFIANDNNGVVTIGFYVIEGTFQLDGGAGILFKLKFQIKNHTGYTNLTWDLPMCSYNPEDPLAPVLPANWVDGSVFTYPSVYQHPADLSIAPGSNGTFSILAKGTNNYLWQVMLSGQSTWSNLTETAPYSGVTSNTLTITNATVGMSGNKYRCIATAVEGSGGCAAPYNYAISKAGLLTVSIPVPDPAGPISGPADVCKGAQGIVFTVPPINYATTYVWTVPTGATIVGGSGTNSITVNFSGTASSGNVSVYGQNSAGNGINSILAITLRNLPTANMASSSPTICPGQAVPISLSLTGKQPFTVTYTDQVSTYTVTATGSSYGFLLYPTVNTLYTLVSIQDSYCYSTTVLGSVNVTVKPAPTVTASNTGPVCSGNPFTLNSTGGMSWSWTGPNGFASTSQNPVIANPTVADGGTYTITAQGPNGCSGSASTLVIVHPPLPANAGAIAGLNNVCKGQTGVSYSVPAIANAQTYVWTVPTGAVIVAGNGTNNITVDYSPSAVSGAITVLGNNGCGNGGLATFNVVVHSLPVATAGSNSPVCEGSTIALTSGGGTAYAWTGPNGFTSTLQNPTISNALAANAGIYTVIVSADGCQASASTPAVVVNPKPVADFTSNSPVCQGKTLNFFGSGGGTYNWSGPNGFGSTLQNPFITNVTPGAAGSYTLTVTNTFNCTSTKTASVIVNASPAASATNNGPLCPGELLQLNAFGGNSWLWSGPAGFISPLQNPTLANVTPLNAGVYSVTVTAANTCSATATTTLTVKTSPAVTISDNGPNLCVGETLLLGATGGGSYAWTGPNGFTSTLANPSLELLSTAALGLYTVVVTGTNNCTATASTFINVHNNPVADAGPDQAIPNGASTTLAGVATGGSGNYGFVWEPIAFISGSNTVPNAQTVNLTAPQDYILTVTDLTSGCVSAPDQMSVTLSSNPLTIVDVLSTDFVISAGETVTLSVNVIGGSGNYGYNWSSDPAGFSSTEASPTVAPLVTTIYTVTVTDLVSTKSPAEEVSGSVTITVYPYPTEFFVSGGGSYCETGNGVIVSLSGSEVDVVYTPYFDGFAGTYSFNGTGDPLDMLLEGNGLVTILATNLAGGNTWMSGSALIQMIDLPTAYNLLAGDISCNEPLGIDVYLEMSESDFLYQLYQDGVPVGDPLAGTDGPIDFGPQMSGLYSVLGYSDLVTCETMMGMLQVDWAPIPATFGVLPGGSYCEGGEGIAIGLSGSEAGVEYILYSDGLPTDFVFTGTGDMFSFPNQTVAGIYTVYAAHACGNIQMEGAAEVIVLPTPIPFNMGGGGSYCENENGVEVWIDGTEENATYELYINGVSAAAPVNGTGALYSFGLQTTPGTYSVLIHNSCADIFTPNAVDVSILPAPAVFSVTGGGSYCIEGEGVAVGLSGSEPGSTYTVYLNGDPLLGPIAGTGAALDFGLQTLAGIYTVVAANNCGEQPMDLEAVVGIYDLPVAQTVTGGGEACVIEGFNIGLENSEEGVAYTLYYDGTLYSEPVMGNGMALDFGIYGDPGTYTVMAYNFTTGCTAWMEGSATITQLPVPVLISNPGPQNIPEGGMATFSVNALNATAWLWQESTDGLIWNNLSDMGLYSGTTTPILTITGVTLDMDGYDYRCLLWAGQCEAVSGTANLDVFTQGNNIITSLGDFEFCTGDVVIPVNVENFFNVGSTSLSLEYNNLNLVFTGAVLNPLMPEPENLMVNEDNGIIYLSHYSVYEVSNLGNGILFELHFTYSGGPADFYWDDAQGACEYTDGNGETLPALFFNGSLNSIGSAPLITDNPLTTGVNEGENAEFHITAEGATSYQWQVYVGENWVNLDEILPYYGTATPDLLISPATMDLNGNLYRCVVTEEICGLQAESYAAVLNVVPIITGVSISAANVLACPGELVYVPVDVTNIEDVAAISLKLLYDPAKVSYVGYENLNPDLDCLDCVIDIYNVDGTWSLSWYSIAPINNLSGKLLDLKFNYITDATVLSWDPTPGNCEFNNFDGDIIPVEFINGFIGPNDLVPSISDQPMDLTVIDGNDATFAVTAADATGFQWQVSTDDGITWNDAIEGPVYIGTASSELLISPATILMDGYKYRVIVQGESCNVTSDVATLYVNPYIATITTTVPNLLECPGNVVYVPVTVQYLYNVAAISLTLNYDPAKISYIGIDNVNPQLQLPTGYLNIDNLPGIWKLSWFSLDPVNFGSGKLLDLVVNYIDGPADLSWDLATSGNCEYDDFDGNPIPADYFNGSIVTNGTLAVVTGQPADMTVTHHEDAWFSVTADNATAYQWQVSTNNGLTWVDLADDAHYGGVNTADLSITNALYLFNGYQYRCLVTGDFCQTASEAGILTVNPVLPWVITTTATSVSACPGTDIIVPINVTDFYDVASVSLTMHYDTDVLTYNGYQNEIPDSWVSDSPGEFVFSWFSLDPLNLGDATIVELLFTYNGGTASMNWDLSPGACEYTDIDLNDLDAVYVDGVVNSAEQTPVINIQPLDVVSYFTTNVSFSVAADYVTAYQWQVSNDGGTTWADLIDDGPYSGVNTETLYINGITMEMNGNLYQCVVYGTCGLFVVTDPASLTVVVQPTMTTTAGETTICGNEGTIPVSATEFSDVVSMELIFTYDAANFMFDGLGNVNPGLNDFNLTTTEPVAGEVHILGYTNSGSGSLTLGNADLFDLMFSSALGGTTAITWDYASSYFNSYGLEIPEEYVDGNLTIHTNPVIVFDPIGPFCIDAEAVELIATPEDGTFTGQGVDGNMFDPSVAGAGEWTITYTYTDEFGCTSSADITVIVNDLPVVTAVTLDASPDGINWSAVNGDLVTGYTLCIDPTIEFNYLDVNTLSGPVNPLLTTAFVQNAFYLDETAVPSGFFSYWAAKGVVSGAAGWQGVMWNIINGTDPMFYIKYNGGTDYELIDGLQYQASGGLNINPLRVSGDYPQGTYTFSGTVADVNGCVSSPFDVQILFNTAPVITDVTLDASYDGTNWSAVNGDLAAGYSLCLDPTTDFIHLDINTLSGPVNSLLSTAFVQNAFYLDETAVPSGFFTYWAAKGVVSGATGWQGVMWNIINGNAPIFYIKYNGGTDYELIDGLQYQASGGSTVNPLRVSGDYPQGTYTFSGTVTDVNGCVSSPFNVQILFNTPPVVTFDPLPSVCIDSEPIELVGTPEGGTFTGQGVDGNMFDPAVAGVGTWNIVYTYTDENGCTDAANIDIVVLPLTEITYNPVSVSLDETGNTSFHVEAVNATSYQWQVSTDGGITWADLIEDAIYSGVYTTDLTLTAVLLEMNGYQYRAVALGLCEPYPISEVATLTVTPIIVTIAGDIVECANDHIVVPVTVEHLYGVAAASLSLNYDVSQLTYVGYEDVNPELNNGYYFIDATAGQVKIGYFSVDPANIGNGLLVNLIFSSNGGYSELNWDTFNIGNCEYQNISGDFITSQYINGSALINPLPLITFDPAGPFCVDAEAVELMGYPVGGTFTGTGVDGNMFDPGVAGPGEWQLTYTYTDENNCTNSASITVVVFDLPVVSFDPTGPFCVDAQAVQLVAAPVGGTFTGPGVDGNMFNPGLAGPGIWTLTYTFTDENACTNFATIEVTVNALPVVTLNNIGPFCVNADPVALVGSPLGGTLSGNGIDGNMFNPALAGVGTWTITYTYTDINGCINSASTTVVVNPLPNVYTVYGGGEYCEGGSGLIVGLNGSQQGVMYQLYNNNVFTGQIRMGTGSIIHFGPQYEAGTYTVHASFVATACQIWMNGSSTVVINPLPVVYGGGYAIICQGSSTQLNAVVSGGTAPFTYNWTPASSLDDPHALNPMASPSTTTFYSLVVTDVKGCSSEDYALVVVNAAPVANAGPDKVINAGMSVSLDATASGIHGPFSYLWTPSIGLNDPTVLIPVASPLVTTTYTLLVTDALGCTATDQVTITVSSIALGYNISGLVTYDNNASTPMTNTTVLLKTGPTVLNTTLTNQAGSYGFSIVPNGFYNLTGSCNKPWGGGNSVDALMMARHFQNLQQLAGLRLLAGDLDGNGVINANDAYLVMMRSVHLINAFPVGDWIFETKDAFVNNADLNINFKALCYGDVNGSHVPAAKFGPNVSLSMHGTQYIDNLNQFTMPIQAGHNMTVGAASLVIDFPADAVEIIGIQAPNANEEGKLVYSVIGNKLYIEFYTLGQFNLKANDVLFNLTLRAKNMVALEDMTFTIDGESQMGDFDANVIENALIVMPKLKTIPAGDFSLGSNYPNPFNLSTTIQYSTPVNGKVVLNVYNLLGEKVAEIMNAVQEAGSYTVSFDGSNLPQGVYSYKIRIEAVERTFEQSKRMIITH